MSASQGSQAPPAQQSQQGRRGTSFWVGVALVVIGLAMLGWTFYEAIKAFLSVGSAGTFEGTFGGALSYLSSLEASSSNNALGGLSAYMNLIIVLLIMAVFLGIALAAGSTVLAKGVQLLSSR